MPVPRTDAELFEQALLRSRSLARSLREDQSALRRHPEYARGAESHGRAAVAAEHLADILHRDAAPIAGEPDRS